jgi:hypothetical protein
MYKIDDNFYSMIEESHYSKFFTKDKAKNKHIYQTLSKQLHPDNNSDPRATSAFATLGVLYAAALDAIDNNCWTEPGYLEIKTKYKTLQIHYLYEGKHPFGKYYVCRTKVIYIFDFSYKKYYNNYIEKNKNLKYPGNGKLADSMRRITPKIHAEYDTEQEHIIVLDKPADVYPLKAMIDNYWSGHIPGRHLTWMISRLMGIETLLQFNHLVLNGLDVDSLFISPKDHALYLFGGWWFAVPDGEHMLGTTPEILKLMPPKVKANKIAERATDMECIRAFGRQYDADCPQPIKNFLQKGSSNEIHWEEWDNAIHAAFGKRKFIKIEVTDKDIYKEIK